MESLRSGQVAIVDQNMGVADRIARLVIMQIVEIGHTFSMQLTVLSVHIQTGLQGGNSIPVQWFQVGKNPFCLLQIALSCRLFHGTAKTAQPAAAC